MRLLLPAVLLLFAGAAHAAPSRGGWVEAHLIGSAAHVRVEPDAHAAIDLTLTYRVVAGTLHDVEVEGARFDALEPTCEVRAEDGSAQSASILREGDHLKIAFDGNKGLRRGTYAVHLHGGVSLTPNSGLVADGALWRISWNLPVTHEGLDGARVVFDLPAAPTEPRAVRADAAPGEVDERAAFGIVATVRRNAERDELELVRPHVARGEGSMWAARVDPKALSSVSHPSLRPVLTARATPLHPPARGPLFVLLFSIGVIFAALVLLKGRAARPLGVRPLVPIPAHALLAGGAMAGTVWLEAIRETTFAALTIALAMLFATFVAHSKRSRGAGVWIGMRAEDALAEPPADPFDLTHPAGAAVALVALVLLVVAARVLSAFDPLAPVWTALDAAALVPLFVTGVRPAPGPLAGAGVLRNVRARIADVRTAVLAHLPRMGGEPTELRLHAQPSAPLPGLTSLEIAVRWDRSGSAFAPAPEVLARVRIDSSAHERLLALREASPSAREPGRKPDERVFRYCPDAGDFEHVLRVLWSVLEERRQRAAVIRHVDRRRGAIRLSSAADVRAAAH